MDRAVRRMDFKYTMRDDGLYRRTVDDVLLKCLDEDQARVAMERYMKAFVALTSRLPR